MTRLLDKLERLEMYIKGLETDGFPVCHELYKMRDELRKKNTESEKIPKSRREGDPDPVKWGVGSGGEFGGIHTIPTGYMNRF